MTWFRNNVVVDTTQKDMYQVMERVSSPSNSYYSSSLVISSIAGALGTQSYRCLIENAFGTDSENILYQREGMETWQVEMCNITLLVSSAIY